MDSLILTLLKTISKPGASALLFFGVLQTPTQAFAQVCLNGPYEHNTEIVESFEQSRAALKQAYVSGSLPRPDGGDISSGECHCRSERKLTEKLKYDFNKPSPLAKACVVAALRRGVSQTAFTCNYPSETLRRPISSETPPSVLTALGPDPDKKNQCMTEDYADYLRYSVNLAAECLSTEGAVDVQSLFAKINNETAFNVSIGYDGGVGLMQVTGVCADEMAGAKGGGRYVLENILKSPKKACEPFRKIAENDLKSPPTTDSKNYCNWVGPGEGLTRSLLYGLGYQVHMRKTVVIPLLQQLMPQFASNREVIREMEYITYGRGGIKELKWILAKHRMSKRSKLRDVLKALHKDSPYVREVEGKMHEVLCLKKQINPATPACKKLKFSPAQLSGSECVE